MPWKTVNSDAGQSSWRVAIGLVAWIGIVISVASVTGCHRGKETEAPASAGAARYSEVVLDKMITNGMPESILVARFGKPDVEMEMGGELTELIWRYRLQDDVAGQQLAGFAVDVRKGVVVRWFPIMGESRRIQTGGASASIHGEHPFAIYVFRAPPAGLWKSYSEGRVGNATEIGKAPDLTLVAKVFSGVTGGETSGERTVVLALNQDDALALKKLMAGNAGGTLAVARSDKVVALVSVDNAFVDDEFTFVVKGPGIVDLMKETGGKQGVPLR